MNMETVKSVISKFFSITAWLVGGSVIALIGVVLHWQYFSAETIDVSVKDINRGDFVSLCIVKPETTGAGECNEYTNVDDIFWMKWNSGTVRSQLASAMTDRTIIPVKVHGYRIEILSMRRNIIKVAD